MGPGRSYGEFGVSDAERFREALPIEADDVALVRRILAEGDLAGLVAATRPPDPPAFGSAG